MYLFIDHGVGGVPRRLFFSTGAAFCGSNNGTGRVSIASLEEGLEA